MLEEISELKNKYQETIEPLLSRDKEIRSQITVLSDLEPSRQLRLKTDVLKRRIQDADFDEDQGKGKSLRVELLKIEQTLSEREEQTKEKIPVLQAEANQIENEMHQIAAEMEKKAVVSAKNEWESMIGDLCDWGEAASRELQAFDTQNKVGLNPYRFFQINAVETPRSLLARLKTFFPKIDA